MYSATRPYRRCEKIKVRETSSEAVVTEVVEAADDVKSAKGAAAAAAAAAAAEISGLAAAWTLVLIAWTLALISSLSFSCSFFFSFQSSPSPYST